MTYALSDTNFNFNSAEVSPTWSVSHRPFMQRFSAALGVVGAVEGGLVVAVYYQTDKFRIMVCKKK